MAFASATIPVGYKQTEVGVIPEDWQLCRLENFTTLITKGTTPTSLGKSFQKSGINFLKAESIAETGSIISEKVAFIDRDTHRLLRRSQLSANDILISIAGVLGRIGRIQPSVLPANTNQALAIIRLNVNSILTSEFLFHYLRSSAITKQIADINVQAAQANISLQNVGDLLIAFPLMMNEQKLISTALSNIDVQIQALENLTSKKRDIKQGTMQELLTGKTRLPGFSGEWDVKSLGQIGEISGAGVDKKIIEGETPVRLVNYLDVYNRSFIYSDELDHYVTAPPSKAIKCSVRKGDVFFTPTSEVRDDIAVSAIAMENIPDGTYSYHVVRLRIRDDWDLNYRAYAFQTKAFLDQAAVLSDGSGTRYVISLPNFRKLKVLVPSKREQQAIGQILSDMDAEIAALEQRLEKTKAIKQGMMQQLLTGRIRLVDPSTPVEASA